MSVRFTPDGLTIGRTSLYDAYATPVALSSPPATLTAGANTALTFANTVYVVTVENNSGEDKRIGFPGPATPGGYRIMDAEIIEFTVPGGTTTMGIYGATASPLNDPAEAVGVVVEGRA